MTQPKPEQDATTGRFLPGNNGGTGRPLGSRVKLGEAFTEALYADFQEHGKVTIEKVRRDDPTQYVRVIAGLLPKEVKIDATPLSDMSDDELSRIIDIIRAAVAPATEAGGRADPATEPDPSAPLPTLQ